MTPKEFAEKYLGRKIVVKIPWGSSHKEYIGVVSGWSDADQFGLEYILTEGEKYPPGYEYKRPLKIGKYGYWTTLRDVKTYYFWNMKVVTLLEEDGGLIKQPNDAFPHVCPKCKSPAYIGFSVFECSSKCSTENTK